MCQHFNRLTDGLLEVRGKFNYQLILAILAVVPHATEDRFEMKKSPAFLLALERRITDLGIMTPTVGALTSQAADLLTNFSNNFASVSKAGRQELAANSV
jgi:hypothetical protein